MSMGAVTVFKTVYARRVQYSTIKAAAIVMVVMCWLLLYNAISTVRRGDVT